MPRKPITELQSEESAVSSPVRRSTRNVNSPAPEIGIRVTRSRRASIDSVASSGTAENAEKPSTLKSRRISALSEDDPKDVPASPRRGRPKIDKSEPEKSIPEEIEVPQTEPVKATRGRRNSIQKDAENAKPAPRTRRASKDEAKEEPKRTLRTRKASAEAEALVEKEKKPRGRRPSIESTESAASTPAKVTRKRGSGTTLNSPEKSVKSSDTESEMSLKLTPINKKNIKTDVANLSTIDEVIIDSDSNQEKSPRKSLRLLKKNSPDKKIDESTPLITKRNLSNEFDEPSASKSPRKSSHLAEGQDGSFTFHLNESLEEKINKSIDSSVNVSINSNSDKENTSPSKVVHNEFEKSHLDNDKDKINDLEVNKADKSPVVVQQAFIGRVSNVFIPKHKECSFLEPMEVDFNDTNMVGTEIEDKTINKSSEINNSADLETDQFKRSDSVSPDFHLEIQAEKTAKSSIDEEVDEVFESPNKISKINKINDEVEDEGFKSQQDKNEETLSDIEKGLKKVLEESKPIQKSPSLKIPIKMLENKDKEVQDEAEKSNLDKVEELQSNLNETGKSVNDLNEGLDKKRKSLNKSQQNMNDCSIENKIDKETVNLSTSIQKENTLTENDSKSIEEEPKSNKKRKSLNRSQQKVDNDSADLETSRNSNKDRKSLTLAKNNPEIIEKEENDSKLIEEESKSNKKRKSLNKSQQKTDNDTSKVSNDLETSRNSNKDRKSLTLTKNNPEVNEKEENDSKLIEEEPKSNKKRKSLNKSQQKIDNDTSKVSNDLETSKNSNKDRKSLTLTENNPELNKQKEKSDKKRKSLNESQSKDLETNNVKSRMSLDLKTSEKKLRKSLNQSETKMDTSLEAGTTLEAKQRKSFNETIKDEAEESYSKSELNRKSLESDAQKKIKRKSKNISEEEVKLDKKDKRRSSLSENVKLDKSTEEKQSPLNKSSQKEHETSINSNEDNQNRKRKSDTDLESPPKRIQNCLSTNAKLDEYLTKKLLEVEESDSSDSSFNFLDSMAEEGEEDTPSEDSNQIIDEGESVGSSDSESAADIDEEYEKDSFVCDDEEEKLLSGEEYDLSFEKTKKKSSRIIDISQESSDTEGESKVYLIGQNAKKEKVDKETPKVRNRIITVSESSEEEEVNIEELLDKETPENTKEGLNVPTENKKRTSSITIIENISVDEVKDEPLKQRIHELVETFTSNFTKGEIAVNLSLEHIDSNSESSAVTKPKQSAQKAIKITPNKGNNFEKSDKTKMEVSTAKDDEESEPEEENEPIELKTEDCVLSKPTNKEIISPIKEIKVESVPLKELEISNHDLVSSSEETSSDSETEELSSKHKKKTGFDVPNKLKMPMKPSKEGRSKMKFNKNKELKIKEIMIDLQKGTTSVWNQLVTDVKNRPKRMIKPSASNSTNNSWIVEETTKKVKPSTSILTRREKAECKFTKFHPKDFKNQMLYNSGRIKRTDSQAVIKKKGLY